MSGNASTPSEIFGIDTAKASELLATLTSREWQVAKLMADGLENSKIAEQLNISVRTLDIHRRHLKQKLGADTSIAVARIVFAKKFGDYGR